MYVSIHAFRGEGDEILAQLIHLQGLVSIHAFRGEGDEIMPQFQPGQSGFNPRLPGGRRPGGTGPTVPPKSVSIHAFRGEGDFMQEKRVGVDTVSIHAFRGEGDIKFLSSSYPNELFQSTPSGGKATLASIA